MLNYTAPFFSVHFSCFFLSQRLFNVETSLSTCENCEAQYAQTTTIMRGVGRWGADNVGEGLGKCGRRGWKLSGWVKGERVGKAREKRKIRRHAGHIFKCKSRHQYAAHTDIDTYSIYRRHPLCHIRPPFFPTHAHPIFERPPPPVCSPISNVAFWQNYPWTGLNFVVMRCRHWSSTVPLMMMNWMSMTRQSSLSRPPFWPLGTPEVTAYTCQLPGGFRGSLSTYAMPLKTCRFFNYNGKWERILNVNREVWLRGSRYSL